MAHPRRYFGTDGVRGTVGEAPITADFVLQLGWAAGRVLAGSDPGRGRVIIGKDTRISGYMFESVLEAGLTAAGIDVQLLGPMPTPGIAYLTRTLHARAGVVISASHNPYQDNGIKFFDADGSKLPDQTELAIEAELAKPMKTETSDRLGRASRVADAAGRYIEFCKSTVPYGFNLRGLKLVVDCAHGATYHIAPSVFDELGANVITIGSEPNGLNINDRYGATAPANLQEAVRREGADLGIAFDGDGDRVVMVDHRGELLDGDELLFIISESPDQGRQANKVVVGTVMTNLGLEEALKARGKSLLRAKVGDRYVLETMKAHGSILGGETSGHVLCLDRATTGDGIVSALQVLHTARMREATVHELKQGMTKHPQSLVNVRLASTADVLSNSAVQEAMADVEAELGDSGRVLLRPSGTEPVVRVMVEGAEHGRVQALAEQLAESVKAAVGES